MTRPPPGPPQAAREGTAEPDPYIKTKTEPPPPEDRTTEPDLGTNDLDEDPDADGIPASHYPLRSWVQINEPAILSAVLADDHHAATDPGLVLDVAV